MLKRLMTSLHEMQQLETRRYISPYHVAQVNAALGRVEATLDMLERAYELNDGKAPLDGGRSGDGSLRMDIQGSTIMLRKLDHRLAALPAIATQLPS